MVTTDTTREHAEPRRPAPAAGEREDVRKIIGAGTTTEALIGGAALVIAIVGLFGVAPFTMLAIATILAGAALLIEGLSLGGAYAKLSREGHNGSTRESAVGGGLTVYTVGGLAGVVLGILAVFGIAELVLIPVAALAMGLALLIGRSARADLGLSMTESASVRAREGSAQAVKASSGAMVLAGIAAAALGALALLNVGPIVTMSLVAMLILGAAALLGGSAIVARVSRAF